MKRVPADGMLHPVALAAVGVLVLNDHALKGAGVVPGMVTGKLSDFAGLAFFPLLLVAGVELLRAALGRPWGPAGADVVAAVLLTGIVFACIQLDPTAAELYRRVWGGLRWALFDLGWWPPGAPARPVRHVMDPTDLVALTALLVPLGLGLQRAPPPRLSASRRAPSPTAPP